MFKKALVGVDQSPAEESLLSCLPDLIRWGIEKVTLAHVIPLGYGQGAGYGHEDDFRAWLEKAAAPLREAGLEITTSITASGKPADELLALARAESADLVVVGSRSHNFLREVFLGSVAREVTRRSRLPVLIARLEPARAGEAETCAAVCSRALDRVLLATDLSAECASAEDAAVQLATAGSLVDCLTVLEEGAADSERESAYARHEQLADRIRERGASSGSRIEPGKASEVITRIAASGDYSLIIVGKHGQGWIRGRIIGSTAARICEIARHPVLMVPLREN